MNSKRVRFYRILPTLMLGGIFIFSGCDKSNDVFNPDRIQEEAKKAFPVKNIDPNQTWETSAICNASVSVNEKTGGTYTIKVYTENPYNTNGNAFLLAKASVTDGQTVNFNFDIPAALQYVYVMKVNDKGFSSAVPAAVENGSVKISFGVSRTRAQMAATRSTISNTNIWKPTVPELNDIKIFPKEVPAGTNDYKGQWNTIAGGKYIITSDATSINCDNTADFYIKGNITLNSIYIGSNKLAKFFILPGATLNLPNGLIYEGNAELSIGKGAKLTCSEVNLSKSFSTIYNAGTIESTGQYLDSRIGAAFYNLGTFKFANANLSNPHFYNSGIIIANQIDNNGNTNFINAVDAKISLAGKFSCENGNSIAVNEGELIANSLEVAGSASFYNESTGKVTITGNSAISSNNSVWDNDGSYTTGTMTFTSGSTNWVNKCKLYVKGLLNINLGSGYFTIDSGSYVECGSLTMDQGDIRMGSKAFFNILGEAKFKHNPKGFIATGEDYAILRMGSAVRMGNQWLSSNYQGKLYVASDHHYSQGNDGSPTHPYYELKDGAQMTGTDNADINIPESNCNPGYNNSTPDGGGDDKVQTYAYAFEDMVKIVGDYDFNDVVLYISTPIATGKENKKEIAVTLKAAGATKQIAVLFKNKGKTQTIFGNVHTALGVPDGTITNTGSTSAKATTQIIEVDENFSLTNDGDFYISVDKGEVHIPNFITDFKAGDVPYAIRIANANWKWAKEGTRITEAYLDFTTWAQDATQESNWYENPQDGKVME